ncbi:MAG TPA: amidohydrolase family protein [Candidatus Limnocylindrales bacterium]
MTSQVTGTPAAFASRMSASEAAVDAGHLSLGRALAALTSGPAAVLGPRLGERSGRIGLVEGAPADLVVFDRSDAWSVDAAALASRGKNSPLLGRELSGRVLLTLAGGRLAYEDPSLGD